MFFTVSRSRQIRVHNVIGLGRPGEFRNHVASQITQSFLDII